VKKLIIIIALAGLAGSLAFGQIRIDAGIAVPIGVGAVLDGTSLEMNDVVGNFLSRTFLPLPELGLHYQFDFGQLKFGLGARAITLIIETMIWPNAFIEYNFGSLVAEAQLGGGAFLLLGLISDFQAGHVFFPDLSMWMKVGASQRVRFGAGITGIYLPEQSSSFPVVVYLAGKITLE